MSPEKQDEEKSPVKKQQNFVRSLSGAMIPIPDCIRIPGTSLKTPSPRNARRRHKPGKGAGRH